MGYRVVIGAVAVASLLSGCDQWRQRHLAPIGVIHDFHDPDTLLKRGRTEVSGARTVATAFTSAYALSYDASAPGRPAGAADEAAKAQEMAQLGMTLIELRCELFFQAIGRDSQGLGFLRREVEILSTALTATLGLAGAGSDVVAAAGIGSGVGLSTLANYENAFFYSPEVGKVYKLVDRAFRATSVELAKSMTLIKNFNDAVRVLKGYQTLCTAHEIRRLVNEAVDRGDVGVRDDTQVTSQVEVAQVVYLKEIATALGVETVLPRDAVLIEWLLEEATPADQRDFICSQLSSSDLREKACAGTAGEIELADPLTSAAAEIAAQLKRLRALNGAGMSGQRRRLEAARKTVAPQIKAQQDAATSSDDAQVKGQAQAAIEQLGTNAVGTSDAASPAAPVQTLLVPQVEVNPNR